MSATRKQYTYSTNQVGSVSSDLLAVSDIIDPEDGGTGIIEYSKGDIIYCSASSTTDTLLNLTIGNTGQVLTISSEGVPEWSNEVASLESSGPLTIDDTTPSTDYESGALIVKGGVGITGDIWTNGLINGIDLTTYSINELSDCLVEDNSVYMGNDPSSTTTTAEYNVGLGINALNAIISGDYNTAVGFQSLMNNTTGDYNTALGSESMFANTDSSYNTAVGYRSLFANTTGDWNIAMGYESLVSNTVGYGNTALGTESMYDSLSGSINTAVGYRSLFANTEGDFNTAIGHSSLINNTIGHRNTAVGARSMYSHIDGGGQNTAVGFNSLYSNQASQNTAVGCDSLYSNLDGDYNTAVGFESMYTGTTGYNNTAVGWRSLYDCSGGIINTAMGMCSLYANTTGSYNAAMGVYSLYANTTGGENTALGYGSMITNTTGDHNTAVGFCSLYYNTTADNNTAVGYSCMYNNQDASYNTAMGYQTLYNNKIGFGNAALGYQTGNNLDGGRYNVILGYGTIFSAATANNQIVIGQETTGYQDNYAVIGNTDCKGWLPGSNDLATLGNSEFPFHDTGFTSATIYDALNFKNTSASPAEAKITYTDESKITLSTNTIINGTLEIANGHTITGNLAVNDEDATGVIVKVTLSNNNHFYYYPDNSSSEDVGLLDGGEGAYVAYTNQGTTAECIVITCYSPSKDVYITPYLTLTEVELLLVGGGGGGGGVCGYGRGGGGGAGDVNYLTGITMHNAEYTVMVGEGGQSGDGNTTGHAHATQTPTGASTNPSVGKTKIKYYGNTWHQVLGGGTGGYRYYDDQTDATQGGSGGGQCWWNNGTTPWPAYSANANSGAYNAGNGSSGEAGSGWEHDGQPPDNSSGGNGGGAGGSASNTVAGAPFSHTLPDTLGTIYVGAGGVGEPGSSASTSRHSSAAIWDETTGSGAGNGADWNAVDDTSGAAMGGVCIFIIPTTQSNGEGHIIGQGGIIKKTTNDELDDEQDITYTVEQFLGGFIFRNPNGGNREDSVPTAELIVAGIPGCIVGSSIEFRVMNTTNNYDLHMWRPGVYLNSNIDANTTFHWGTTSNGGSKYHIQATWILTFLVIVTNVDTPAVSYYHINKFEQTLLGNIAP